VKRRKDQYIEDNVNEGHLLGPQQLAADPNEANGGLIAVRKRWKTENECDRYPNNGDKTKAADPAVLSIKAGTCNAYGKDDRKQTPQPGRWQKNERTMSENMRRPSKNEEGGGMWYRKTT